MPTPEHLAATRFDARFPIGTDEAADPAFRASWIKASTWVHLQRMTVAHGYRRNHATIVALLAGHPDMLGLGADLVAYPDDPRVTWRLLRALCQAKRAVKPSVGAHYNLGVLAYDGRLDAAICGEILLLRHQRADFHQIAAE